MRHCKNCLSKLQKSGLFWLLQTVALFPWIELWRKRSLIINNPPFFFNRIVCHICFFIVCSQEWPTVYGHASHRAIIFLQVRTNSQKVMWLCNTYSFARQTSHDKHHIITWITGDQLRIINWVALLILHSCCIGLPPISFCLLYYTQSHSHWSMCANVTLLGYMRHQFRGSIRHHTWPCCVSWSKRETVAFLWHFMSFKLQGQQVCGFFWVNGKPKCFWWAVASFLCPGTVFNVFRISLPSFTSMPCSYFLHCMLRAFSVGSGYRLVCLFPPSL